MLWNWEDLELEDPYIYLGVVQLQHWRYLASPSHPFEFSPVVYHVEIWDIQLKTVMRRKGKSAIIVELVCVDVLLYGI